MKNRILELRRMRQFANYSGVSTNNPLGKRADFNPYASMQGNSQVQQVQGVTAEVNVVIKNTDEGNDLVVDLFRYNEALTDAFNGGSDSQGNTAAASKGLIVTINGQSHEKYKRRTVHQPFLVEGLRVFYPTEAQLAENWKLITEANNRDQTETYTPSTKRTAGQQQTLQIDDAGFGFEITADSGIQFLVKAAPSATVPTLITLSMNIRAITDISENLKGRPAFGYNPSNRLGGNNLY